MLKDRPIYVLDTNVLVDYVDIIPGNGTKRPTEPTIALDQAHIVIPTMVIRELSSFKREQSDRGRAARTVLRRLRRLVEMDICTMERIYNLEAPIFVDAERIDDEFAKIDYQLDFENRGQIISILPVHKNFRKSLPFHPSDGDMDGQIILTTLTVGMLQNGKKIDGSEPLEVVEHLDFNDVILVTNDNGLAIRARERGLRTERYGYKYPEPYTGRRNVVVPRDLFYEFYNSQGIPAKLWREMMPEQSELIANEFIVMSLENRQEYPSDFDPNHNPYFCHIGKYDKETDEIIKLKYLRDFPIHLYNDGQAIYAEALMDPNISAIICTGPAGSGKTYMATVYGYQACKNGQFIGVTVVPCDSHSKLGALPGDLDEKMDPDVQPLKNALRNYLLNEEPKFKKDLDCFQKFGASEKKKCKNQDSDDDCQEKKSIKAKLKDRVELIWNNWFSSIPIENARGRDFSYELAIYDEFQDQSVSQADTLIKRLGTDGKIVISGDIEQIHAPYIDSSSSGLVYASRILMDSPMVAQVSFTEEEVIRHPLVKMVATRQKALPKNLIF